MRAEEHFNLLGIPQPVRGQRQRAVGLYGAVDIHRHRAIEGRRALVIYACVMGLQFKQAMHEQADALGESLTTQTATSATGSQRKR